MSVPCALMIVVMAGMIMGLRLIGKLIDPTLDVHAPPAAVSVARSRPRGEVRLGQQQAVGECGLLDHFRLFFDLPQAVGPGLNLDLASALVSLMFLASFCQFYFSCRTIVLL